MGYYDDDDLDIHVRHRDASPRPVRYVQSQPRPRYYPSNPGPSYLVPEQRTTVVARARSRSRSGSYERRRDSPPQAPAGQPIIIHNSVYQERDHSESESDESDYGSRRRRGGRQAARRRRHSSSSSSASGSSRSRSHARMTRQDWEAEQTRQELERLRIAQARDEDQRRLAKQYRDQGDLERAKKELDEIKHREAKAKEAERIKRELELQRLKEEEEAEEQRKLREKEAQEAVERYKHQEAQRIAFEKQKEEENEREYKRRIQEDLIKSGLDEKAIAAILNKEKIPEPKPEPNPERDAMPLARATYTRMARRHLSIETLRVHHIEWDFDVVSDLLFGLGKIDTNTRPAGSRILIIFSSSVGFRNGSRISCGNTPDLFEVNAEKLSWSKRRRIT
jgi:hypothetical protein